jgi:hypothetical protein
MSRTRFANQGNAAEETAGTEVIDDVDVRIKVRRVSSAG